LFHIDALPGGDGGFDEKLASFTGRPHRNEMHEAPRLLSPVRARTASRSGTSCMCS